MHPFVTTLIQQLGTWAPETPASLSCWSHPGWPTARRTSRAIRAGEDASPSRQVFRQWRRPSPPMEGGGEKGGKARREGEREGGEGILKSTEGNKTLVWWLSHESTQILQSLFPWWSKFCLWSLNLGIKRSRCPAGHDVSWIMWLFLLAEEPKVRAPMPRTRPGSAVNCKQATVGAAWLDSRHVFKHQFYHFSSWELR